jgi:L-ascorbate metabolism protein UlaG (beta-lactamase superfamily)
MASRTATGRITWLGHATAIIDLDGIRVVTDPVLRRRVAHLRRHAPAADAPSALDAVLISHVHRDHADGPSLRRLPSRVPVIAPAGSRRTLRRLGVRRVIAVRAGERVAVGAGTVLAVHADHDGRRTPVHASAPALGFVVEQAGRRVYFAGDTDWFEGMVDVAPVDAALLPIWGWGPSLGPGHMDPERAAAAASLLRPRLVVPIHWGTYLPLGFRRGHPLLSDPGTTFAEAMRRRAPGVRVEFLRPAQSVDLPA